MSSDDTTDATWNIGIALVLVIAAVFAIQVVSFVGGSTAVWLAAAVGVCGGVVVGVSAAIAWPGFAVGLHDWVTAATSKGGEAGGE